MQTTIYSTATCPYCRMLKKYLAENAIPFTEKMVDQDETALHEMMKDSGGFLGVPFSVVVKDDGSKDTVIGFDKGKIDTIFGIQNT